MPTLTIALLVQSAIAIKYHLNCSKNGETTPANNCKMLTNVNSDWIFSSTVCDLLHGSVLS